MVSNGQWMTIPIVFAYIDRGSKASFTKWKPRRVECTQSGDHRGDAAGLYIVKYGSDSGAFRCLISELVCTQLLASLGVRTLSPHIVEVTAGFAASCNLKSDFIRKIVAGKHFGTPEIDAENGPPIALSQLSDPEELVLLWVGDTWLGNIDRANEGNILLQHAGGGTFHVIAADQSDCFGGTDAFGSEHFPRHFMNLRTADAPKILPAAIWKSGGTKCLNMAIAKVTEILSTIPRILASVPSEWWHQASINPTVLESALMSKSQQLEQIIQLRRWEVTDGSLF
jgi:hypothetical protein